MPKSKVNVVAVRPQTFFERWKDPVKKGFINAMTLFFALGMGLLSFAGLIELVPLVALGLASFVFTAAIIGSVYQGSIRQGVERLITRRYTAREQCRDALIAHYDRTGLDERFKLTVKLLVDYIKRDCGNFHLGESDLDKVEAILLELRDADRANAMKACRRKLTRAHGQNRELLGFSQALYLLVKEKEPVDCCNTRSAFNSYVKDFDRFSRGIKELLRLKTYLKNLWNLRALQSKRTLDALEKNSKERLNEACKTEEIQWLNDASHYDKRRDTNAHLSNAIRNAVRWQQYVVSPFTFVCAALAGVSMFTVIAGIAVGGEGAILSVLALFGVNVATSAAVTAAMVSGLGIAALAAIPYMFAIYHTLMKLFNHQRVLAWKKSVSNYVRNKEISPWKRGALVVVVVLTIALTVTATVFTAGGWWQAAAAGAKVFAFVGTHAQPILEAFALVTVPFYAFAFFAFSITHSVQAMSRFVKQAKNPLPLLRKAFVAYRKEHGWVQTFNPIVLVMLLLSVPLKMVIFLLHNISEALVNVKEGGSQGVLGVIFISADDMATEANEVFHEHAHIHKLKDKESIDSLDLNSHNTLRDRLDEHEGGCNHGPLDMLVYIIQIPALLFLHPLAALWDCTVGNCSRSDDAKKGFLLALADSWNWLHQKLCMVVTVQMLDREIAKQQKGITEQEKVIKLEKTAEKETQQVSQVGVADWAAGIDSEGLKVTVATGLASGPRAGFNPWREKNPRRCVPVGTPLQLGTPLQPDNVSEEQKKVKEEKDSIRFFKVLWFGAGGSVCAPASAQACC